MKKLLLVSILLTLSACATFRTAPAPTDITKLYGDAVIALSVAEQGLETWTLLAKISGHDDAYIAKRREVWMAHIRALQAQLSSLEAQLPESARATITSNNP